jgi:hypothetical protein
MGRHFEKTEGIQYLIQRNDRTMNVKEHLLLFQKFSFFSVSQVTYVGFSTEFKIKYHIYSFSGILPCFGVRS